MSFLPDTIYYGTNSQQIGWVAGKEWWYRKSFAVPASWQGKRVWLHFDGVDYLAELWLNGHCLGKHEGQFTPFDFEAGDALSPGKDNVLTVLIHAAPAGVNEAIARYERAGYGGDLSAVFQALRDAYPCWKCQTSAGWDWGAKIITMGIWKDVRLIATEGVRLSDLTVLPRLSPPYDQAVLRVRMMADSLQATQIKLNCHVRCLGAPDAPVLASEEASLGPAAVPVEFELSVPHPRLWWPNGYGAQPLYELTVAAQAASGGGELDRAVATFGIRDLQMLANPEPGGTAQEPPEWKYLMQINGRRVFARGGDWIPCDMLYGRPRWSFFEHLISLAARASINLFRVWGGGLIDKPAFYDLCDRYGIMLFQEFPNAGTLLPETTEALAIAARETREVLPVLMNHPCIVRYGAGNEWPINVHNSPQMAQLRRICNELDPSRSFHDCDPECAAQHHGPYDYDWESTFYATYNNTDPMEWNEYGASAA